MLPGGVTSTLTPNLGDGLLLVDSWRKVFESMDRALTLEGEKLVSPIIERTSAPTVPSPVFNLFMKFFTSHALSFLEVSYDLFWIPYEMPIG